MIATSAPLMNPPGPMSVVAFCGLLDVVRLSFTRDGVPTEVCEACQTINLGCAKFCKGCDGKLPAYYAALKSSETAVSVKDAPHRAGPTRAHVLMTIGVAVLVAGAAVFAAMRKDAAVSDARRTQEAQALSRIEPAADRLGDSGKLESLLKAPPADEVFDEPSGMSAIEPAPYSKSSRRSAPTRSKPPSSSLGGAGAQGVLAQCDNTTNFVSRAVCINNRCAQRSTRHSVQCADAVRQRRIDEARRNPTLIG